MSLIESYCRKWRLQLDGAALETRSAHVAPVKRDGVPAILKIFKPGADERGTAQILTHWGGSAAVVLAHDDDAVLLERAIPGTTLAELALKDDDRATEVWCDVAGRLHTSPAPPGWQSVRERGRSFLLDARHPLLPPQLVAQAAQDYFALCDTQSERQMLLHGDLHHFNILSDRLRGWIVIDPKGVVGEAEFETGTLLRNPIPYYTLAADPNVMQRRVHILRNRLGFDPSRVLRWCAAQNVLSAIWSVQDNDGDDAIAGAMKVAATARALLSA